MSKALTTTQEIADRMGITPRAVLSRAVARGIVPAKRIGVATLWDHKAARAIERNMPRGRKKSSAS